MQFRPKSTQRDPGWIFKSLIRLCGLVGLMALAFPYFHDDSLIDIASQMIIHIRAGELEIVPSILLSAKSNTDLGLLMFIFLAIGPVLLSLASLFMFIIGKYQGGPFSFILFYTLAGWMMFQFMGPYVNLPTGFFKYVGTGYWIQFGAMGVGLLGMILFDKS